MPVDPSIIKVVDDGIYSFSLESNANNVVIYGWTDGDRFECDVIPPYPYNDVQTVFLERKQGLWQTIRNAIWNG